MRRQGVAVALAVALVLPSGCADHRVWAEERRVLIESGMSAEDVRRRLGAPARVFPVAPVPGVAEQTTEVWSYAYEPAPDVRDIANLVLAAGALILIVGARGGGSVGGGIGGRGSSYRFWVGFGADGRVRGVTNLEEVK